MRRLVGGAVLAAVVFAAAAMPGVASAHVAGPCDGDGTGRSYAKHHISAQAGIGNGHIGTLGGDGHIPGIHMGFSACLGVH